MIFAGTVRDSEPPKPPRLGLRVSKACQRVFNSISKDHTAKLIDPLDYDIDPVFKLHFAYPKSKVPKSLEELPEKIEAADGYIVVSPEYNHSMSPALANLLNHSGSSLFAYKPSAIVRAMRRCARRGSDALISIEIGLSASICDDSRAQSTTSV